MPAAANLLKTLTAGDAAAAPQPVPGGEVFAAMLSGTETIADGTVAGEVPTGTAATVDPQPNLDILAPLLAQQQVVPTVTVPKGGDTAAVETAATPDTGSVGHSSQATSPARVGIEPEPVGQPATTGPDTVPAASDVPNQAPADAVRPRSAQAEIVAVKQGAEPADAGKGMEPVQANVAETVKAADKGAGQATQPATATASAPAIAASAQSSASDQKPSGGGHSDTPTPTIEVQAQQGTSTASVTDVRSLIASLTGSAGVTATAGPAQAAPAQQLGEALAAQVLDLAGGGEWLDQLSQEISRAADGSGPLRFRLTPESLGELKVEISQSERGTLIRMTVATEAAQAVLADAQPKLVAEARAQGLRIADAQVDLAGSQSQQHQQGRESARQQAANTEQPLRAFRGTPSASTGTQAPAATHRSAERYA